MRVRRTSLGIATVSLCIATGWATPPANGEKDQAQTIKVSFDFANDQVLDSESATAHYSVRHNPTNARIQLQRRLGGTWVKVTRLRAKRGTITLPPQPLGEYAFRVAVLQGGRVLTAKKQRLLSFGQINVSALLEPTETPAKPDSGTYKSFSFSYRASFAAGNLPQDWFPILRLARSSCLSFALGYVSDQGDIFETYAAMRAMPEGYPTTETQISGSGAYAGALNFQADLGSTVLVDALLSYSGPYYASQFFGNGVAYCFTNNGEQ